MTRLERSLREIAPGDRVFHRFFRSRGTVLATRKGMMLIEFDNTDRQLLTTASIRLLQASDLHPEERFMVGERVQHWQTGVRGVVRMQYGDRVVVVANDGGRRETCHAKHLLRRR